MAHIQNREPYFLFYKSLCSQYNDAEECYMVTNQSFATVVNGDRMTLWGNGNSMDKDSKGQRKFEESGIWIFPAVEGHSIE